jgi:hypothetical protein
MEHLRCMDMDTVDPTRTDGRQDAAAAAVGAVLVSADGTAA